MDLTAEERQALAHLAPLADLLWLVGADGVLRCLITAPEEVAFASLSLTIGTPSIERVTGKGNLVLLPFTIQVPNQPAHAGWSCLNPSNPQERRVLSTLSKARSVQFIGVTAPPDLRFVGEQPLLWNRAARIVTGQGLQVAGVSAAHAPQACQQAQQQAAVRRQRQAEDEAARHQHQAEAQKRDQ